MANRVRNMAAKKQVKEAEVGVAEGISLLSIDYGREDINNIAMKVNELINKINNL